MNSELYLTKDRGHANHGWLNSYHSFSFGGYHNPNKVHFGALRVLNDDTVNGGMGFGKHPHENMEIISIPLEGKLEHQDSMGNKTIISKGEVQILSAGTGIFHSEKNYEHNKPVKFLQIWVFPDKKNIEPRYDQKAFHEESRKNSFQTIVSPLGTSDEGIKINQNAWFSLIDLKSKENNTYVLKNPQNGVFVFVISGEIVIDSKILNFRDALGINNSDSFEIHANLNSEVLLMEIPMEF